MTSHIGGIGRGGVASHIQGELLVLVLEMVVVGKKEDDG